MVHRCKEKTRKGRAQLEFKLASALSDTKKDSLKYTYSKRRSKEDIGAVLCEDGHLTDTDGKKLGMFNACFYSVFNTADGPCAAQCPKSESHECRNSDFSVWTVTLSGTSCIS